ncbi:hypothetical protein TNCV_4305771 [Trichonephila clavipes]|nr:hypothetical protein TNCV_4305771 [Trichonephila clavipes]
MSARIRYLDHWVTAAQRYPRRQTQRRAFLARFYQRLSDSGFSLLDSQYCKYPNDEAHFWLNAYVNKQNCRIWSEANPQVYVETPLHPEKLTVWCALWAGGILLQKR